MSETNQTPKTKVTLHYLPWGDTETIVEEMDLPAAIAAYSYFQKSNSYLVGYEVIR